LARSSCAFLAAFDALRRSAKLGVLIGGFGFNKVHLINTATATVGSGQRNARGWRGVPTSGSQRTY